MSITWSSGEWFDLCICGVLNLINLENIWCVLSEMLCVISPCSIQQRVPIMMILTLQKIKVKTALNSSSVKFLVNILNHDDGEGVKSEQF